jgi:hypothetical protein
VAVLGYGLWDIASEGFAASIIRVENLYSPNIVVAGPFETFVYNYRTTLCYYQKIRP